MKMPSEFINRGSLFVKPIHGEYFDYEEGSACLIGTMYVGMGFQEQYSIKEWLKEAIQKRAPNIVMEVSNYYNQYGSNFSCGNNGCIIHGTLTQIAEHLYESGMHRWSRAKVAKWMDERVFEKDHMLALSEDKAIESERRRLIMPVIEVELDDDCDDQSDQSDQSDPVTPELIHA